jgi:hypothetical protein
MNYKQKYNVSLATYIALLAIFFTLLGAWCVNIYKLVTGPFDITGEFILRIVGIFAAPLGSIMGFV